MSIAGVGNSIQSITNRPILSVFNILDYGATGDGVTDDASAIQSAINACQGAGGGIVYFPEGLYICSGVTVTTSGVMLCGAGFGATVVKAKPGNTSPVISFVGISIATGNHISGNGLEDIALHGNSTTKIALSLKFVSRFSLCNVFVQNVGAADGVYIEECFDSAFYFLWVVSSCAAGSAAIHIKNGAFDDSNTLYFIAPHLESITGDYIWLDVQGTGGNNNNIHFSFFHIEKGSGTNTRAVLVDNNGSKSQEQICFEHGTFVNFDSAASGTLQWNNANGSGRVTGCFFNNGANGGIAVKITAGTMQLVENRFFNYLREVDHTGVPQAKCAMRDNQRLSSDGRIAVIQEDGSVLLESQAYAETGFQTLTNNSTTPSVAGGRKFLAANAGPTTITDFLNPGDADEITILATNGNTTIQNNANIALAGAANYVMTADDTLTLIRRGNVAKWFEKCRSVN